MDKLTEQILLKEEERGMNDLHVQIKDWFKKHPRPSDDQVHKFAEELGVNPHKFEEHVYMILGDLLKKETIQELFVQTGEIEGMPKGKARDLKILRIGMIAELDAVNLYDRLSEIASDSRVTKLMLDVSHEEKVHAGEFETLMERMDPKYEEAEKEGEKEVDELL